MEPATEPRRARLLNACLAGIHAGIWGAFWMLLWLGISAKWQRRSFWTTANLMASAFHGSDAIRAGFAWITVTGLALVLFLYAAGGVLFVCLLRGRLEGLRAAAAGMLFGAVWYVVWFRLGVLPLVTVLHSERPAILGHLIYGAMLGRFPAMLRRIEAAAMPAEEPGEAQPDQEPTATESS